MLDSVFVAEFYVCFKSILFSGTHEGRKRWLGDNQRDSNSEKIQMLLTLIEF